MAAKGNRKTQHKHKGKFAKKTNIAVTDDKDKVFADSQVPANANSGEVITEDTQDSSCSFAAGKTTTNNESSSDTAAVSSNNVNSVIFSDSVSIISNGDRTEAAAAVSKGDDDNSSAVDGSATDNADHCDQAAAADAVSCNGSPGDAVGETDELICLDDSGDASSLNSEERQLEHEESMLDEEERRAEKQNQLEEQQMKREMEARAKQVEEKELQQQRHKRLMNLLTKSEFYSQFLLQKIEVQSKKLQQKREKTVGTEDEDDDKENSSQDSSPGTKRKARQSGGGASKRRRRRRLGAEAYDMAEVMDGEEAAKAAAQVGGGATKQEEEGGGDTKQPQLLTGATLRQYQLDGFSWLKLMYENGINGLLADEMGLGKTIQSIALLCHLVEMGVPGPFLVVAPLSTLYNWCNEIKAFAPQLPWVLFHGPEQIRRQKALLLHKKTNVTITTASGATVTHRVLPIAVTSYEMVTSAKNVLGKLRWRYLIVDEGHRIKNYQCRLVKSLKLYSSSNRLLLTGTPLQNSLSELWSLLNFLLPEVFDSLDVFESWFDVSRMGEQGAEERIVRQEKETQVIATLHKILSPFLLRRVKADVEVHLPPKRELLLYAHMTPLQLKLYTATLTRDFSAFGVTNDDQSEEVEYDAKGRPVRRGCSAAEASERLQALLNDDDSEAGLERFLGAAMGKQSCFKGDVAPKKLEMNIYLQNILMQSRKVVNHPYLVAYPLTAAGEYKVDEELVSSCGKLQVLDQLLAELYKRGHKVLLFSQMTKLLDIVHDYLQLRPQYNYRRLDGRVSLEDRQYDIDAFNKDPSVFLFILSTRAGSLGINLTAADTVIIYDSDWNPQQDLQAQDRCHRIGQTRPVLVLRLVTAASVDERIVERASSKRCLEKLIIKAGSFRSASLDRRALASSLDRDELMQLLEKRDHHSVYRTASGGAGVYSKQELDRILDRSELVPASAGTAGPAVQSDGKKSVFRVVGQ